MKAKQLQDGERMGVFALVFERGDRVMAPLVDCLREHSACAARLMGIGAFRVVTLGYFDWERKASSSPSTSGCSTGSSTVCCCSLMLGNRRGALGGAASSQILRLVATFSVAVVALMAVAR